MAGAGYKLFNTGDVLTAAQVNTYLQEQAVMRFANAAARTTALSGVLAEGMVSYLMDTNALEVYDGSAWVGAASGDITAVTAGTGISGGGTSGAVTITNSMATEITAAGDIIVGTGSGTFDNLPIGTTGQVLTADTTVSPYKVKWAAAAGGGDLVRITTNTFSAQTSLVFTDCFSSTYDNYLLIANVICSTGTPDVTTYLRASGSNYTTADQARTFIYTAWSGTVSGFGSTSQAQLASYSTNTARLNFYHQIFNPFLSVRTQMIGGWVDSTDAGWEAYYAGNTNSYTSLNVTVSSGTFSGEISIYGYKRS